MNAELSCRQCRDALVELTAGTLPTADRQAVERHFASCPDCRHQRDGWLALGDAIRERGQRLPLDGSFAIGLVRLRAALALQNEDDFESLEGEDPSMEHDPRLTDSRAPTALHDANRPFTVGALRGHSYRAVAATVTIVLLSALVFGVFGTKLNPGFGSGAANSATPTATPAPGVAVQPMPALPAGASVTSISMISASDGWATAEASNGGAMLLRYAGGRWTPSGDTFTGIYLTDISMDSHDDGWAVGARSDQVTGVVLHYSGGRWSQVQTPTIQFGGWRVWAFSPSRVLVLASLPKGQSGRSALLRYDNGAWTETVSPRGIGDVSILSSDDIWAACFDGHILHYQGGNWTTYTITGQPLEQSGQPLSISMLSDSDGWVGGSTNATPRGMFLAHFDGRTWARIQGPAATGQTDINAIAMVSAGEGWAGGHLLTAASGPETVLLHYVNGQWEATPAPYSGTIGKIVMVSATEGWAPVSGGGVAGLLHYQNGHWMPYGGGPVGTVGTVWGSASPTPWIPGQTGTITIHTSSPNINLYIVINIRGLPTDLQYGTTDGTGTFVLQYPINSAASAGTASISLKANYPGGYAYGTINQPVQ